MVAFLLLLLLLVSAVSGDEDSFIGVNIGTDISDMPSPTEVVAILKAQGIRHVRLYHADRAILLALANTGIRVTVPVPNDQLLGIGQSNATAAIWVARNIVSLAPATNITAIAVGSEVLNALPNAGPILVSALKFIHSALVSSNLDRSYLMLNVYPYYDYMQSNGKIPLDYALFRPLPPNKEAVDANTLLHYTNVFDAVVDAAYFAMSYLNFTDIPLVVMESGWPSKGDSSEPDAIVDNANTYNSNLIKLVLNKTGTPKHPRIAVSTYIDELYNEDLRTGSDPEKNWGLFDANGIPVYTMHLTGAGEVDCSPLLRGHPCYDTDNVVSHSAYAFNTYCQRMAKYPGTCDLKGVASIATTDPMQVMVRVDFLEELISVLTTSKYIEKTGSLSPLEHSQLSSGLYSLDLFEDLNLNKDDILSLLLFNGSPSFHGRWDRSHLHFSSPVREAVAEA
ncbi:Glucan endo-1,3-beta-glucosidase 2 [Hibiscus syriacus]|uniref:glucan endo-1,3-beta-D-glucosidase n=1 Tax=Hibiscus syriacus TaxID=106335 RepID=A0A6A2X074_HIBSY|nr:Glucan endo-1,3-beta-glucosidase 2 [Hibiscus syriacus]